MAPTYSYTTAGMHGVSVYIYVENVEQASKAGVIDVIYIYMRCYAMRCDAMRCNEIYAMRYIYIYAMR